MLAGRDSQAVVGGHDVQAAPEASTGSGKATRTGPSPSGVNLFESQGCSSRSLCLPQVTSHRESGGLAGFQPSDAGFDPRHTRERCGQRDGGLWQRATTLADAGLVNGTARSLGFGTEPWVRTRGSVSQGSAGMRYAVAIRRRQSCGFRRCWTRPWHSLRYVLQTGSPGG